MPSFSMLIVFALGYGVAYFVHGRKGAAVSPTVSGLIAALTAAGGYYASRWQQSGNPVQPVIPGTPGTVSPPHSASPVPTIPIMAALHFMQPPTTIPSQPPASPAPTPPAR